MNSQLYTYRNGKKIYLTTSPDQFVVRALPEQLTNIDKISDAVQVSSASSIVTCSKNNIRELMDRTRNLAPTYHDYRLADSGEEFLITDRIFITFAQSASAEDIDKIANKYGLIAKHIYSKHEYLFQLTKITNLNPVELIVKLTEDEEIIESADHDLNYKVKTCQLQLPEDPMYERQWHLHGRYDSTTEILDSRASARCEEAWQLLENFGSADVVIGFSDDGCKLDHPDFNSPEKFAGWAYFQGTDLITKSDPSADSSKMFDGFLRTHGTSCAGVAAAEIDGELTVGAAPGCKLLPIKFQGFGNSLQISDSKLFDMLEYIENKVDILSNSWGSPVNNLYAPYVIRKIKQLAQDGGRRGKGIVFLWAAGNDNAPLKYDGNKDIPYSSGWKNKRRDESVWIGVKTASKFEHDLLIPEVMHVAALASNAQRSHYSNYGTGVDICAPSSNRHLYRRRPSIRGLGITTADKGLFSRLSTDNFGGTSSATPLVAGIAALVISANPNLKAKDVISILKKTASKALDFTPYPKTPPGNPSDPAANSSEPEFDRDTWVDTSWDVSPVTPFDRGEFKDIGSDDGTWSPWFGYGRVDALAAVREALRFTTTTISSDFGRFTARSASISASALEINDLRDILLETVRGVIGSEEGIDLTTPWSEISPTLRDRLYKALADKLLKKDNQILSNAILKALKDNRVTGNEWRSILLAWARSQTSNLILNDLIDAIDRNLLNKNKFIELAVKFVKSQIQDDVVKTLLDGISSSGFNLEAAKEAFLVYLGNSGLDSSIVGSIKSALDDNRINVQEILQIFAAWASASGITVLGDLLKQFQQLATTDPEKAIIFSITSWITSRFPEEIESIFKAIQQGINTNEWSGLFTLILNSLDLDIGINVKIIESIIAGNLEAFYEEATKELGQFFARLGAAPDNANALSKAILEIIAGTRSLFAGLPEEDAPELDNPAKVALWREIREVIFIAQRFNNQEPIVSTDPLAQPTVFKAAQIRFTTALHKLLPETPASSDINEFIVTLTALLDLRFADRLRLSFQETNSYVLSEINFDPNVPPVGKCEAIFYEIVRRF